MQLNNCLSLSSFLSHMSCQTSFHRITELIRESLRLGNTTNIIQSNHQLTLSSWQHLSLGWVWPWVSSWRRSASHPAAETGRRGAFLDSHVYLNTVVWVPMQNGSPHQQLENLRAPEITSICVFHLTRKAAMFQLPHLLLQRTKMADELLPLSCSTSQHRTGLSQDLSSFLF